MSTTSMTAPELPKRRPKPPCLTMRPSALSPWFAVLRRLAMAIGLLLCFSAQAHDGEDHSAPKPAAAGAKGTTTATPIATAGMAPAGPRLLSQTDQFELVGVLQDKVLTLYLDQFDTNAPVTRAQIELESGPWKGTAVEEAPGVYRLAAGPLVNHGKHAITVSVQAGDASDLMEASLEVGPTPAPANGPGSSAASTLASASALWKSPLSWGAAVLVALAALAALVMRAIRQKRAGRFADSPRKS